MVRGARSSNFIIDTKSPVIESIQLSHDNLTLGESATVTVIFSEAISGFGLNDIDLSAVKGTVSNLVAIDGLTDQLTFTPMNNIAASGNILSVIDGSYTDIRGNSGAGKSSESFVINTLPQDQSPPEPFIVLSTQLVTAKGMMITIGFNEPVQNFDLSDLDLSGIPGTFGSLLASSDGLSYSMTFTPDPGVIDASNQIHVRPAAYTDIAGNAGLGASSANFAIDTAGPVINSIETSDSLLSANETLTVTLNFTEPVVGFDASDFDLTAAAVQLVSLDAISATTYSAVFAPVSGAIQPINTIVINGAGYADVAGNEGTTVSIAPFAIDAVSEPISVDTRAPSLVIGLSDTQLVRGESLTLSFTFSEAVSNFSASDVLLDGAPVNLSGFTEVQSGRIFQAIYTPASGQLDSSNVFSVAGSAYTDLPGNTGVNATSGNFTIDTLGDIFYGTTGSDRITGTAGADRISGVPQLGARAGKGSIDSLTGLGGADIFVLGTSNSGFYNDGNDNNSGQKDYASIADFSRSQGDKIEVKAGTYFFSGLPMNKLGGTGLYLDTNGSGSLDQKDELIGFLVGVAPSSMSVAQDLVLV